MSEIDKSGHTVTIKELKNQENGFAGGANWSNAMITPDGKRGEGIDPEIHYNPAVNGAENGVPLNVLHHEGVHTYNMATGTLQPGKQKEDNSENDYLTDKLERQCVGLPVENGIPIKR